MKRECRKRVSGSRTRHFGYISMKGIELANKIYEIILKPGINKAIFNERQLDIGIKINTRTHGQMAATISS